MNLFCIFRSITSLAATFVLGVIASPALFGADSNSTPPAENVAAPHVTRFTGTIAPDEVIDVTVLGLDEWAAKNDPAKLVPFVDGRPLTGNYPAGINIRDNTIKFHLQRTAANRPVWNDLLGEPRGLTKKVTFSVGLENASEFATDLARTNAPNLVIILSSYGIISLIVIGGTLAIFFRLAATTDLIRDAGAPLASGRAKPYNLAKTQMAFWFLLTYISFIIIWLITDEIDTVTPGLLVLMGISASTALGAVLIDAGKDGKSLEAKRTLTAERSALVQSVSALEAQVQTSVAPGISASDDTFARNNLANQLLQKRTRLADVLQALEQTDPAPDVESPSLGFFRDLMSDGEGYCFHRFQMVIWTCGLGVVFVSGVYNNLTMPEFSLTQLGLMGISSGTYLGLKFPEKR